MDWTTEQLDETQEELRKLGMDGDTFSMMAWLRMNAAKTDAERAGIVADLAAQINELLAPLVAWWEDFAPYYEAWKAEQ